MVNVFWECNLCGEVLKTRMWGEHTLTEHLKKFHPNEFEEMNLADKMFREKVAALEKKYHEKQLGHWFSNKTEGE